MKLIALRRIRGTYGLADRGDPIEVSVATGESLIRRGLAQPAEVGAVTRKNPAAQRPLAGGRTGGAKPSSSSRPAKAPKASTSSSPKAGRKSPA